MGVKMLEFIEIIKIVLLGVIEGITEWLPISSTGHMLIFDEFITLKMTESFKEIFFVVIQLGAILAVILTFFKKMWPFNLKNKEKGVIKKQTFSLWLKVIVAVIPSAIIGLLFDDFLDEHFYNPLVITIMLILYGVLFIVVETINKKRKPKINNLEDITYLTALYIGLFQVLSLIPGTSRSGATIIGALLIGVSRVASAEFTFFLAVPTMVGASLLKIVKYGFAFTSAEIIALLIGMAVAFIVSVLVIKFLMGFIKKYDFKVFGYYRIVLGVLLLSLIIAGVL